MYFWPRFLITAFFVLNALQLGAQQTERVAAEYPNRPVRWVIPFVPGGSTTVIARIFADKFAETWGQQFVVDNRGGAGGLIAADIVAKAVPDGYTLLFANPGPNVSGPLMAAKATYRAEDLAPVILFGTAPLIIIAHPAFPPKNPRELVDYLRANPAKVNWGSTGTGGVTHVGLLIFQAVTRTNYTHVPYKGNGPAFIDLAGGHIQLLYATTLSAESLIKAGRVKVIGIASAKRSASLPALPTLAESGIKSAEIAGWFGISAPAKTPRSIIEKLNVEANKILHLPESKKRLDELGLDIVGGEPRVFGQFLDKEVAQVKQLIAAGALKQD